MQLDITTINAIKDNTITPENPAGEIILHTITTSQLEEIRKITSDPIPLESIVLNVINTTP